MTLQKTQQEALAAATGKVEVRELSPQPIDGPIIVQHAAFELSPAAFDEITRKLRDREYHHAFHEGTASIFGDHIAFTRGHRQCADESVGWILERRGLLPDRKEYIALRAGVPAAFPKIDDALRFSRMADANAFLDVLKYLPGTCSQWSATNPWVPVPHIWG